MSLFTLVYNEHEKVVVRDLIEWFMGGLAQGALNC